MDIAQVLYIISTICMFMNKGEVEVHKHAKRASVKPSWRNKLGQYTIYYMENEHYILAGNSG